IEEPKLLKGQQVRNKQHEREHDGQLEYLFIRRQYLSHRLRGWSEKEVEPLEDGGEEDKHRQRETKVGYELRQQISCKIWKRLLLTMVAKINLQRLQQSDLDQNREGHAKHEEAQEVSYVRQPVLSFQLQRKPV